VIRRIVASSLTLRRLVLAIAVGLMVFGIMQLRDSRADVAADASPSPPTAQGPSASERFWMLRLSSPELSRKQVSALARSVIRPRLLGVDGVAGVDIGGGRRPPSSEAGCRAEGCLLLLIERVPETSAIDVTAGVNDALDSMRPELGDLQIESPLEASATVRETSFDGIDWALLAGAVLLVLVVGALVDDVVRS
jgi:multidrug efflux pump subunit AcrB